MFLPLLAVELLFDYVVTPTNFPNPRYVWPPDVFDEFCSLIFERGTTIEEATFWGTLILGVSYQRLRERGLSDSLLLAIQRNLGAKQHLYAESYFTFCRALLQGLEHR